MVGFGGELKACEREEAREVIVFIAGVLFFLKCSGEQVKGLGAEVVHGNACCQLCWAPAMVFIFFSSPELRSISYGVGVASLNCL